jgi:hypothetical protein
MKFLHVLGLFGMAIFDWPCRLSAGPAIDWD